MKMTLKRAKEIAGTLSFPSKMPSSSYDLPATACIIGSKLAKVEGTVCSKCYALPSHHRGGYKWPKAIRGMKHRLASIRHAEWIDAMIRMLTHTHNKPRIRVDLGFVGIRAGQRIRYNVPGFHRWHSSGDLQSVDHLAKICAVARNTPGIAHWLPTQELGMVDAFIASGGVIPKNLLIRVSNVGINDPHRRPWQFTASVVTKQLVTSETGSHNCPAHQQENQCKSCRACWSRDVSHIIYELH